MIKLKGKKNAAKFSKIFFIFFDNNDENIIIKLVQYCDNIIKHIELIL